MDIVDRLFNNWPLQYYRAISRLNRVQGKVRYVYDIDNDAFYDLDTQPEPNKATHRLDKGFLILGEKATWSHAFSFLKDYKRPTVPAQVQARIDANDAEDPLLMRLSANKSEAPAATKPAAVEPPVYSGKKLDVQKIAKQIPSLTDGTCINIATASRVRIGPAMTQNNDPVIRLCIQSFNTNNYPNPKAVFAYIEDRVRELLDENKQSSSSKGPVREEVVENESNKMSKLDEMKKTVKPSAQRRSPVSSPSRATGPLPRTMEMDNKIAPKLGHIQIQVDEYQKVNSPMNGDILNKINQSTSSTRPNYTFTPTGGVHLDDDEDFVASQEVDDGDQDDEEEEEEIQMFGVEGSDSEDESFDSEEDEDEDDEDDE